MDKAVDIEGLSFTYPDGHQGLKNIDLVVYRGEAVAVIGPNGAGKSTLLLHLNGILRGNSVVKVFGLPVEEKNLKEIRRKVGLIFQDPEDQLFSLTVFDDVAFGPINMGYSEPEVKQRVTQALEWVGMNGYEQRSPHHLSIGEKKRIAIATVLSLNPELLVLDEPTSNLDPRSKWSLFELLRQLPVTKIVAAHDLELVRALCQRTVVMDEETGKVICDLADKEEEELLARGGRGGRGNSHFATSTNQTPRFAQGGMTGTEMKLVLLVKTIADVGLVGIPNAGKSTLLSVLTDARPKIGDYPFTTLHPNLGVMNYKGEREIIIADIPGLIKGAHDGLGLGIRFLKHIERTRVLLFLIDLSQGSCLSQSETLSAELKSYSPALLQKPRILVGSKEDISSPEQVDGFLHLPAAERKVVVSSVTRTGLDVLKDEILFLMEKADGR